MERRKGRREGRKEGRQKGRKEGRSYLCFSFLVPRESKMNEGRGNKLEQKQKEVWKTAGA